MFEYYIKKRELRKKFLEDMLEIKKEENEVEILLQKSFIEFRKKCEHEFEEYDYAVGGISHRYIKCKKCFNKIYIKD